MQRTIQPKTDMLVSSSPVYYGYVVWFVATIGLIATSPGQSFTVSLFFDPLIEEFNLDRTTISGLYGLGTFIASLSLTWVGRWVDRYGNRRMSTIISLLFCFVLVAWSTVSGPLGMFIGFIAIRGLGQGSLSLSSTTVIAEWFKKRRGLMMSLSLVGFSIFQSQYILVLERLLREYAWRDVWLMLGIAMGVFVVPISWLLLRNKPEDHGLLPDNAIEIDEAEEAQDLANSWTLQEAMRTPIFWIFVAGRFLPPAWGTGLILHQVSIFSELGYDASVATATYSQFTLMSAGVAIAFGWLIDRFRPGLIMSIQLIALIASMALATMMTEQWLLTLYAIAFAVVMGGGGVFDGAVWTNIFGREHQGSIRGFVTTSIVIGSAVGPIVFGISFDYFGGYAPVLWLGVALAIAPTILALFARSPQRA